MDWVKGRSCTFAYGAEHGYLVVTGEAEARLARFSVQAAGDGLLAAVAREVTESTIIFPLGRGPGRPGAEPEVAALAECAKSYAERFEAGESLEGYPAWQQPGPWPLHGFREADPNIGRCSGPGGCFPGEDCDYRAHDCAPR
jgi:hypothetical protein